jgi:phage terminase small subunit
MPAGRPRKPIALLKQEKKTHLTKKQIAERENSEVRLGSKFFDIPEQIKNNLVAYKKWQEVMGVFEGTDYISSSDISHLTRYCITWSEWVRLCETRDRLCSLSVNWSEYSNVLPEDFQEAIEKALSLSADLQLETQINKKNELLIKMEDRSLMNISAKLKGTPNKEPKPKRTPLQQRGFGNV